MTPDIYQYPSDLNPGSQPVYKYGVVFEKDEDLDILYPSGPFCFYIEASDIFDYDKLEFILVGLRWDPVEIIAIYDGVGLDRVQNPAQLTP